MPLVEVLMSTYDGERHVREQVDSILAQEGVAVRLVVRDDGSRDGTLDVLRSYRGDPRIVVLEAENIGLPDAFFRLIQDSGGDADYWALADQDDVWLPHKLARAVARLRTAEGPGLYCARVLVVDEDLQALYPHPLPMRGPSFANALVQNIATGCTIVINLDAREVLRDRWPSYAVMHDAWLYLVVSPLGTVIYDPDIAVHYRQHADNVVGMGRGRTARVIGRLQRQLSPGGAGAHGRQDRELMRVLGTELPPCRSAQLQRLVRSRSGSGGSVGLCAGAHRQSSGSEVVRRLLHLAGRA